MIFFFYLISSSPHFVLFHSYSIARKDIQELDILNLPESELCAKPGKKQLSPYIIS